MWDKSNFLLKGFINEVKGVLTESGSSSGVGGGSTFSTSVSCRIPKYDHRHVITELANVFTASAIGEVK